MNINKVFILLYQPILTGHTYLRKSPDKVRFYKSNDPIVSNFKKKHGEGQHKLFFCKKNSAFRRGISKGLIKMSTT